MTPPTTDTSREAVELACEHVETHERNLNNGFPMMCEIGMDIHALIAICRAVAEERDALVAERDALRDQLEAARNEALEEVLNHFEPDCLDGERTRSHCEYAQREILALKSTTTAPRDDSGRSAKQLDWSKPFPPGEHGQSYDHVYAHLPHDTLYITWKSWKEHDDFCCHTPWGDFIAEPTLEKAKTAVQISLSKHVADLSPNDYTAPREVTVQEAARVFADVMQDLLGEPRGSIPETADAFYDGSLGRFTDRRILRALAKDEQNDG